MIKDLRVLVYNSPDLAKSFDGKCASIHEAADPKKLVRALIESPIDIVICAESDLGKDKIQKIFDSYQCAFFVVDGSALKGEKLGIYHCSPKNLIDTIEKKKGDLALLQVMRRNQELVEIIESLKKFEVSVDNVARELFISEIKEFFGQSFKVKQSYWVDLPPSEDELPPILRITQELQRQKINMVQTVNDLEQCEEEILSKPAFQVWKNNKGKYIALLWFEVEYKYSQCLILSGLEFHRLENLHDLFNYLIPIINRRWNICCAVQDAQEEVYRDSLTKLYNQKFLYEILIKKIEEYKRYKTPFTILFIDVDFFKKVNDTLGHVVGSNVLIELGNLIYTCIRQTDYAFRYGGDEFVVLLSHTEGENADFVAERIREKVEDSEFLVQGKRVKITVSIGLASYPVHASSAEEIIQIADEAMYYGKNKSRNIVYKAS